MGQGQSKDKARRVGLRAARKLESYSDRARPRVSWFQDSQNYIVQLGVKLKK